MPSQVEKSTVLRPRHTRPILAPLVSPRQPKARDGKKAVAEAKLACELSSCKSAPCLETLAAAAAETGDFDAAVRYQWMAIDGLTDDDRLPQFLDRLELYRAKQPYRDVPPKNDRPQFNRQ
jgi:hypothetical protein